MRVTGLKLTAVQRPNPRRVQPKVSRKGLTGWDRPPHPLAYLVCRYFGHQPAYRTERDAFRTCRRCHTPTEWIQA